MAYTSGGSHNTFGCCLRCCRNRDNRFALVYMYVFQPMYYSNMLPIKIQLSLCGTCFVPVPSDTFCPGPSCCDPHHWDSQWSGLLDWGTKGRLVPFYLPGSIHNWNYRRDAFPGFYNTRLFNLSVWKLGFWECNYSNVAWNRFQKSVYFKPRLSQCGLTSDPILVRQA